MKNKRDKGCFIILITILMMSISALNASAAVMPLCIKDDEGRIHINKSDLHKQEDKVVFLTFDDGPSHLNTERILNLLVKNEIKASFFIIGKNAENNKTVMKKMMDNNMAIYPHCYEHDYSKIYSSRENYIKDFEKCVNVIRDISPSYNARFMRMPGGSDNTISKRGVLNSIKSSISDKGYTIVDWNIDSRDTFAQKVSSEVIKRSVIKGSDGISIAVVLFHDAEAKITTAEALQDIIDYYKKNNYKFKTFNEITLKEKSKMIEMRIINKAAV